MRKSIKKMVVSLLAASMVVSTMTTAFAEDTTPTPVAPVYSVVGTGDLGMTGWDPAATDCQMTKISNSVYKFSSTATATNADAQFKIVKDGPDEAWANQMQYGTGLFGDNKSQFSINVTAGDKLDFIANVLTGELVVLKNGANDTELKVRWDSKDESPADYTSLKDAMKTYVAASAESTISVVGSPDLCVNWAPDDETYFAVNKGGVFVRTLVATADSSDTSKLQFKIVKDGVDEAWANQMIYGTGEFGDNKAQFELTATKGDIFEVFIAPSTGDVTILKNGAVDSTATVRPDTKDEAPADFISLADAKKALHANDEAVYSIVGATDLAGLDWAADNAAYIVNGTDGVYTKTVLATADSDKLEFKIVKDGPDEAWSNQLELGTGQFHDNASQFRVAAKAGDVITISFNPSTGDVNVLKNAEAYDYLVRWSTKDEDPADFLTKAEALAKFVPTNNTNPTDNNETTTAAGETTTVAANSTTTAANAATTAAAKSVKTGDVAPIALMVTLFAAVVAVVVVAKKKEA